MSPGFALFLLVATAVALFASRRAIRDRLSPTRRALRRAERGETERALADLSKRLRRRPDAAVVHGTIGQVQQLAGRPQEAEGALRRAIELGTRDPLHLAALGWSLVAQDRLDEALPFAAQAHERDHEDFGVHCLYCGLMARAGRGAEVVPLYEFLRRRALQIRNQSPGDYEARLGAQFEFARHEMERARSG
jgi:tetratricopeptide (TPR) repeat protein